MVRLTELLSEINCAHESRGRREERTVPNLIIKKLLQPILQQKLRESLKGTEPMQVEMFRHKSPSHTALPKDVKNQKEYLKTKTA